MMTDPSINQAFPGKENAWVPGMTIREHFASMAMAAMIGRGEYTAFKNKLAQQAIEYADALAEELLKSQ